MARTAVVAGTASATAGAVSRRQQGKAQAQAQAQAADLQAQQDLATMQRQMADLQAQQAAASIPPPVAAPAANPMMEKLQQLGQMKQQGLLTDEEFTAAKARILAG